MGKRKEPVGRLEFPHLAAASSNFFRPIMNVLEDKGLDLSIMPDSFITFSLRNKQEAS